MTRPEIVRIMPVTEPGIGSAEGALVSEVLPPPILSRSDYHPDDGIHP